MEKRFLVTKSQINRLIKKSSSKKEVAKSGNKILEGFRGFHSEILNNVIKNPANAAIVDKTKGLLAKVEKYIPKFEVFFIKKEFGDLMVSEGEESDGIGIVVPAYLGKQRPSLEAQALLAREISKGIGLKHIHKTGSDIMLSSKTIESPDDDSQQFPINDAGVAQCIQYYKEYFA